MSSVRPHIRMVVAYARNRSIGMENQLPWRLPADLAHFKKLTLGLPIIMGRKTWESLGRPLPGRPNLVISRNADYVAEGATVYDSLRAALAACQDTEDCCIIGGEQIFTQGLEFADDIYATEVQADVPGDTFFPELNTTQWQEVSRSAQPEENGYSYDFVHYTRKA